MHEYIPPTAVKRVEKVSLNRNLATRPTRQLVDKLHLIEPLYPTKSSNVANRLRRPDRSVIIKWFPGWRYPYLPQIEWIRISKWGMIDCGL